MKDIRNFFDSLLNFYSNFSKRLNAKDLVENDFILCKNLLSSDNFHIGQILCNDRIAKKLYVSWITKEGNITKILKYSESKVFKIYRLM